MNLMTTFGPVCDPATFYFSPATAEPFHLLVFDSVFAETTEMKSHFFFLFRPDKVLLSIRGESQPDASVASKRLEKPSLIPNSAAAVILIPSDVSQSCLSRPARVCRSGARQSGGEQREVLNNKDGNVPRVSLHLATRSFLSPVPASGLLSASVL